MQVGAITSSLMYNCSVLSNLGTDPAKESHLSCAAIASFTQYVQMYKYTCGWCSYDKLHTLLYKLQSAAVYLGY